MKLSKELKQKVVKFLMNGDKEFQVVNSYGPAFGNASVYSELEVKEMVNKCGNFSELEDLVIRELELESVMGFGEVLDLLEN